jgi:hypothetical protein
MKYARYKFITGNSKSIIFKKTKHIKARIKLVTGPAAATNPVSLLGFLSPLKFTGTGFA